MEGFADLLTDAFSDTSVPTFPDGDLEFENLNFDGKSEEDKTENITTKKDGALLQEATVETAVVFVKEAKDMLCMIENVYEEHCEHKSDEEDFRAVRVSAMSMDKMPKEDYTSSDGESEEVDSASGDDDEDEEDVGKPGNLLLSVHCSDDFYDSNKEDGIFVEGQPLSPVENPQVSNKEQGEAESDEEVSYFKRVPEQGSEVIIDVIGTEGDEQESDNEKQEDTSDPESEGMKIEQKENVPEVENLYRNDSTEASLEFPSIPLENLLDLIAEVDSEECGEKMKDFSGEENQEAGETFADYPSDFSSCEYVEDEGRNQESKSKSNASPGTSDCGSHAQQNTCLERVVMDVTWTGSEENPNENEGEYLHSRDLETDADELMSLDVAGREQDLGKAEVVEHLLGDTAMTGSDETGESNSYSSSDDEVQVRRNAEELLDYMRQQDLENNKPVEDIQLYSGSSSDHIVTNSREGPVDFINWEFNELKTDNLLAELAEFVLTTEDTERMETGVNLCSTKDDYSYSIVQREESKTTSPSNLRCPDDSFFFNTEIQTSRVTELGQLGDDEYEEERNWEQEQARIKAFYEYYGDSDEENGREGRQTKVQFRADSLSQLISYETDSSDRYSLSSSTDMEESSAETSDEPYNILQNNPECDPPNTLPPESTPDFSNTQTCAGGKHKCLGVLKLMLKMGLVTAAGFFMFWLASDQADWLSQVSFF